MDIIHFPCGVVLSPHARTIDPTDLEASRGVESLNTRAYWCNSCRTRIYYKQENYQIGQSDWLRVKKKISAFSRRLELARESDWVWGWRPDTYEKIKVIVR